MFGTLVKNDQAQRKESLTFVENTDPASALSRSRRDKPHTSCEFCRSRKVRCSGQPTGCDRCVAVFAECRYPSREPRRRKRAASRRTTSTDEGASWAATHATVTAVKRSPTPHLAKSDQGNSSSKSQPTTTTTTTTDMFDGMDLGQPIEQWLSSYDGSAGSSSGGSCALDECLDIDNFLNSSMILENTVEGEDNNMVDQVMGGGSLSGDADSLDGLNGFDDIDPNTPTSNTPSPAGSLGPILASPYDMSPLTFPIVSTYGQSQASCNNNNNSPQQARRPTAALPNTPQTPTPAPASKKSSNSPASVISSSTDGCRCMQLTARLLDDLGAESADSDPAAMDVLMRCFRGALVHCGVILDCERCTALSENNMLLAMAGTYMSNICERIVMCYIRLWGGGKEHEYQQEEEEEEGKFSGNTGEMWFSTYRIESDCERMQVLKCLVTVQLAEFGKLLEKLKMRADGRRGHLALLTEAEKRIKAVSTMLKASDSKI